MTRLPGRVVSNEEIIEALWASRGNMTAAARRLGIARWTIYRRAQTVKKVRQVVEEAREMTIDMAETQLSRMVNEGDFRAINLVLRTIGKTRGYTEVVEDTDKGQRLDKLVAALERNIAFGDDEDDGI